MSFFDVFSHVCPFRWPVIHMHMLIWQKLRGHKIREKFDFMADIIPTEARTPKTIKTGKQQMIQGSLKKNFCSLFEIIYLHQDTYFQATISSGARHAST